MHRPTHRLLATLAAMLLGAAGALAQDAPIAGGPTAPTGTLQPPTAPPTLATPRAAAILTDGAHSHPATEAALTDAVKRVADLELIVAGLTKRVKDLEEAKPPEPPPPPPTEFTLVPGLGAEPNPLPVDVTETNAKHAITSEYRSATLAYGASRADLGLYDNSDSGPIPRVVEFSLNGGPWIGTRSGVVIVPGDLPDGAYQIRMVQYPASGMSIPLPPGRILKATVEVAPGQPHTFIELQ